MKRSKKSTSSEGMTRSAFLKTAGFAPLAGVAAAQQSEQGSAGDLTGSSGATFRNAAFELHLQAGRGLRARLKHVQSGLLLADGAYSYSFGEPEFGDARVEQDGTDRVVRLEGVSAGNLEVKHVFRIPADSPWIEEQITLTNRAAHFVYMPQGRCGFVLPIELRNGEVAGPLKDYKFTAVPFRREPTGNREQYADYAVLDVLTKLRRSNLRATTPIRRVGTIVVPAIYSTGYIHEAYPQYASEGWLLSDSGRGFVISKYSQEGMEWALLDRLPLDKDTLGLRWGGWGIYERDPEQGAGLQPGASHEFGVTRISAYEGGLEQGFYTFREEMDGRGHGCPEGFDPPVHWNELYDNKLWWLAGDNGQDDPENRRKLYQHKDLVEEAVKASDIGCESLYLDPGWDTNFASKIWDEERLGSMKDFTELLRKEYGLKVSLHCPLSGWCNPSSYSRDLDRMGPDGKRIERSLCGSSRQYVEESAKRFDALGRSGAAYFMFDGTMFNGECWDPGHGHAVPSTREEHVQATNRLARLVHKTHPHILIEMHDQMLGGTIIRYVPTYYGHGMPPQGLDHPRAHGYDCVWAYELMWDPMTDLVGGHSIALYYYNLAYSVPLYIHIDLRKDNEHALMLWWNMSTCRYLGIGGTHNDIRIRRTQKEAMTTYRRLSPIFKAGRFYGIDEQTHVHVHPTKLEAVVNCFNLGERSTTRTVRFDPAKYGLDPGKSYRIEGADFRREGDTYRSEVEIPGYGHRLLEIRPA